MAVNSALWLEWLEATDIATAIRQSTWLYPFIEIIHIFGIVMVAGAAGLFDILVLFYSRKVVLGATPLTLLSLSKKGLLVAIPSGVLLFSTNAKALGADPTFHLKLILLILAGVNAWIFHTTVYLPTLRSEQKPFPWKKARVNAVISLLLWMSIISCGRLLAY